MNLHERGTLLQTLHDGRMYLSQQGASLQSMETGAS